MLAILEVKTGELTSGQCEARTNVLNSNFSITADTNLVLAHSAFRFDSTLYFFFPRFFSAKNVLHCHSPQKKSDVFFFHCQNGSCN